MVPSSLNQDLPDPVAQTFLDNLGNVEFKDIPLTSTDSLGLDAVAQQLKQDLFDYAVAITGLSLPNAQQKLNDFFAQYGPLSQSFPPALTGSPSFMNQLENYLDGGHQTANNAALTQGLVHSFYVYYRGIIQGTGGNDLNAINPHPPTITALNNQFDAAFSAFATYYPYQASGGESTHSFLTSLFNFTAVTSLVNTNDVPITVTLASYADVYRAFKPNPPPLGFPTFGDVLTVFYKQQIKQQGYFIPSQSFGEWVTFMQQTYTKSFNSSAGNFSTSVDTASSKGVIILDKVILDLIQMINSLQNVAAAQAKRLNFLTQWQQAYTDEGNQVHYFVNGSDGLTGNTSKQAANVRNNLNSVNQNYSQSIQANQNTLSDDAKSLQSNVDQSNTAVNNQSDIGNSIFQQLSTILTSIFQG